MEKLSIEKFREFCNLTQKIYEIFVDEEKQESMPEEELERLQEQLEQMMETLKNSDLSEIPYEEWENFTLIVQELDLENTGANIDFNLIRIPEEVKEYGVEISLKGCNVRNFDFDKSTFRYTDASFDEEFVTKAVEENENLFPERRIQNQDVKERFRTRTLTLKDVKEHSLLDIITIDDLEYSAQSIVRGVGGLEKALEIDDEILADEDLLDKFSRSISNDKDGNRVEEEYSLEATKTRMFERIEKECFGYSSESAYEKYSKNPYVTSRLPELFVEFSEEQEDLRKAFASKELTLNQVIDNYEMFKGKKFILRLEDNGYDKLTDIYEDLTEEKLGYLIERFPDVIKSLAEVQRYAPYSIASKIDLSKTEDEIRQDVIEQVKLCTSKDKELLEHASIMDLLPYKDMAIDALEKDDYRLEAMLELLEQEDIIEALKERKISPTLFGNRDFTSALYTYGARTILEFDARNGGFFTKNNCQELLSLNDKFFHYGGNVHEGSRTIYTKGWDLKTLEYVGSDSKEYSKEEFEESMRRMIIYGPTDGTMGDRPLPFWEIQGEFRENNTDLYLSENVPEDLATRFYQGILSLDDIRFSRDEDEPVIREILSKNIELMFRRSGIKLDIEKMDPDIIFAIAKENGSYLNLLENPSERYYRSFDAGKFDFEGKSLEEVQSLAREAIESGILSGKIPYGEKAPEYIKERHPELFLSLDAPEELKRLFYKKNDEELYREKESKNINEKVSELTIDTLIKNPEYIEFLKGKNLSFAKIDSKLKKFVTEFGEEEFFKLMEHDAEAIKIIAEAGNTYIERFKTLLETRPDFYAQKELRENDGYTEEELNLILSGEETGDERILQGRRLLESKKEKFRDFIITSPGYVIHCPDEKLDEFNFTEYKDLERLSKFDISDNYRRDTAEQIITSMYCFLGYGSSREVMKLPEVSEEELEEAIRNTGVAVSGIYENVYSVQGNLKTVSTLFDKFGSMLPGGKKNFAVYKSLNDKLEQGYDGPIEELLRTCLIENEIDFDDRRLETIVKNAVDVNTAGKMNLIKDDISIYLRDNIQETPENIKILNDILNTALKRSFAQKEEINFVTIQEYIQKEFSRTRPDGTSFYSPHVTDHMQELLDAVSSIQNNPELAEKLNLSVTDILKQEKEKIGKGWIRKLLDIKTRLTEKEKTDLEARLYGEDSSHKIEAIKSLELKDKSEEGIEEAYTLLKEMQLPGVFTFEKGEIMFAGLTPPYSENFKNFFMMNMTEILSKPEYYTEFQKMHGRMDAVIKDPNIMARFHSGRYTIKELLDDIQNISFDNIEPGEHELAYRAKKAGLSQEEFNIAKTVHAKMLEREKQTVPPVEYKGKRYVGRILRIDDPLHFTIGNITTCCQRFGQSQPGESSMLHSATEENGSVFVVEEVDEYGNVIKPVAQSWTWRNGDRVCFDNVEIPNTVMGELESTGGYDEIFGIYTSVAQKMIDIDQKALGKLLDEGKITKEQYEALVIKQVTVGGGCDDLLKSISPETRKTLRKATSVSPAEMGKRYSGVNKDRGLYVDSNVQYVLAENDDIEKGKTKLTSGEISFGYVRKRDVIRKKDIEIHPDLISRCKAINERAGEETKAQSIISRLESANITTLTRDYYSELSGRSLTLDFSENDDWYIFTSEGEKDIQINDSILLPKDGASQEEAKLAKMEYAKQILLIAKLAMEKQKTLVVNLEREGKFIDFAKFAEKDIIIQKPDGTIEVKDPEKLEELLKSLDERLNEGKDQRIVDTAIVTDKTESDGHDDR